MKERLLQYVKYAKYAGIVGYPAFYIVCLCVFFSFTFPYGKLKERILASYNGEKGAGGGQKELQIDEMEGYWLSGIRMRGVRLLSLPTEPGKPLSRIEIDEATARYSVLPALVGNSDLSFHVYAFGGETTGSYSVHGADRSMETSFDTIDIGKITPLVESLGVPLRGKLTGTIRLEMPEAKASKASGSVALEAKEVAVGDGKAKLRGALALPQIDVGTVTLSADAKDGTLKFTKLAAGGKDLELQGDGRIAMREVATDSLCDAQVRFKINDVYRNKNDITKSLFGAPGSNSGLFDFDPKVKQSKRPDGFYAWNLRGTLGRPDFVPAGTTTPGLK